MNDFSYFLYHHLCLNNLIYIKSHQLCYLQNVHHGQKKKIKADDFFNLSASSNSHDFSLANFEYTRNRLLWATREVPSILAIPRDLKDIHKDGKARGHYKKGIEKEH